jgi:hypothetical protein
MVRFWGGHIPASPSPPIHIVTISSLAIVAIKLQPLEIRDESWDGGTPANAGRVQLSMIQDTDVPILLLTESLLRKFLLQYEIFFVGSERIHIARQLRLTAGCNELSFHGCNASVRTRTCLIRRSNHILLLFRWSFPFTRAFEPA